MRLVCVLFTCENNSGRTDGPIDRGTDRQTHTLIEMQRRISKFALEIQTNDRLLKNVSADLFTCLFVGLYLCLIQTMHLNNEWKWDFLNIRCLIYQVDSILIPFSHLQIFLLQKSPWNTAQMAKILQPLKTYQKCHLRHAEHNAKNRSFFCGLDQNTLFLNDLLLSLKKFEDIR